MTKARFIRRILVALNAIKTIENEMINLIKLHYLLVELHSMYKTGLRPRLHETGTKSNRDHFVSAIVLFIIDVYMRPGQDENNSGPISSHSACWTEPTDFRPA